MKTYNLFLDDIRNPEDVMDYINDDIYWKLRWQIVRSHKAFKDYIKESYKHGYWPKMISFDHDLGSEHYKHLSGEIPYDEFQEMTGYHSAKWLVSFCIENNLDLPEFRVHSMNPVGAKNIREYLSNFNKFKDEQEQVENSSRQ